VVDDDRVEVAEITDPVVLDDRLEGQRDQQQEGSQQ
jgi:hypothetical protein